METAIIAALIAAGATIAAAIINRLTKSEQHAPIESHAGQRGSHTIQGSGHGSDSSSWKDWPPTPEVIAVRTKYKDDVWAESDIARIRQLLGEYWDQEQRAWVAGGKKPWNEAARNAFFRDLARVKNPVMAIRVIENVQNNKY